jgi:hypothetical protein
MTPAFEPAVTVKARLAFPRVDEKNICRLIRKGESVAFEVAGARRFPRSERRQWTDSRMSAAGCEVDAGRLSGLTRRGAVRRNCPRK